MGSRFCRHLAELFKLQGRLLVREKSILVASAILMNIHSPGTHRKPPRTLLIPVTDVSSVRSSECVRTPRSPLNPNHQRPSGESLRRYASDTLGFGDCPSKDSEEVPVPLVICVQQSYRSLLPSSQARESVHLWPQCSNVCVRILGHPRLGAEYTYDVDACVLCGSFQTTMSPPTIDKRLLKSLLSIDGGGCRGTVPLRFLAIL